MGNKYLTLIPSNWLFNASVIGFLKFVKKSGIYNNFEEKVNELLQDDGSLKLDTEIFEKIYPKARELYLLGGNQESEKSILESRILGKNDTYNNYLHPTYLKSNKSYFEDTIKYLSEIEESDRGNDCIICYNGKYIPESKFENLPEEVRKFLNSLSHPSMKLNNFLFGSLGEFPNSFWNCSNDSKICHLCSYLLIHHHLAMTKLNGETYKPQIFINSNSFKTMWYFSELLGEYSKLEKLENIKYLAIPLLKLNMKVLSSLYSEESDLEVIYYYKRGKEILPKSFILKQNVSKIL